MMVDSPRATRRRERGRIRTHIGRPHFMAIEFHASGERPPQPDASAPLPFWRRKLYQRVPALDSLRHYSPTLFRRDLFAGVTVAAVAVPQAMAYASIFGMPVQYGLYTAIVMTAVGALFDSSKQLINGPTNAISIAMLSALAGVPSGQFIQAAILMALLIGLMQTGITLLRLGDLSRYISHAVIVGFTAGASVLLVLDQLKNVLGLKAQGDGARPLRDALLAHDDARAAPSMGPRCWWRWGQLPWRLPCAGSIAASAGACRSCCWRSPPRPRACGI